MRAQIPANSTVCPRSVEDIGKESGVSPHLLQDFWSIAEKSESLIASTVGVFSVEGEEFRIPRFIFLGPRGGGDTFRLAIFCTLRGDEPEGAEALAAFFQELEQSPELARGFHLYAYPVCNPAGLARGTRNNAAGRDLAEEFWSNSNQPEVYYLEREIGVHNFHGVISLHTIRNSSRFQIRAGSEVIEEALARDAGHPQIHLGCGGVPDGERGFRSMRLPDQDERVAVHAVRDQSWSPVPVAENAV